MIYLSSTEIIKQRRVHGNAARKHPPVRRQEQFGGDQMVKTLPSPQVLHLQPLLSLLKHNECPSKITTLPIAHDSAPSEDALHGRFDSEPGRPPARLGNHSSWAHSGIQPVDSPH